MKKDRFALLEMVAMGLLLASLAVLPMRGAQSEKGTKTMAQALVDQTHAKHPEATEIGIAINGTKGCTTIAATDKSELGEKCEKEDSEPITSGKPYVEKENGGFDVTLPLHDSSGKIVGSVGIEQKPRPGQTQDQAVALAQAIAKEMEVNISSKASLLTPAK